MLEIENIINDHFEKTAGRVPLTLKESDFAPGIVSEFVSAKLKESSIKNGRLVTLSESNPVFSFSSSLESHTDVTVSLFHPSVSSFGEYEIRANAVSLKDPSWSDLITQGFMDQATADLIQGAYRARANIIISGGSGAGKTTFLQALLSSDKNENLVIMEEFRELKVDELQAVSLTYSATDINKDFNARLRATLRLTPDNIIVGEIRQGLSASTLHPVSEDANQVVGARIIRDLVGDSKRGLLTTLHANNVSSAMSRFNMMALPESVSLSSLQSAPTLLINLERSPGFKNNDIHPSRFISQVAQVVATSPEHPEGLRMLFSLKLTEGGRTLETQLPTRSLRRLIEAESKKPAKPESAHSPAAASVVNSSELEKLAKAVEDLRQQIERLR